MDAIEIVQQRPLDKLVAEHAELRKKLGPNHVLVRELWSVIRNRQKSGAAAQRKSKKKGLTA